MPQRRSSLGLVSRLRLLDTLLRDLEGSFEIRVEGDGFRAMLVPREETAVSAYGRTSAEAATGLLDAIEALVNEGER